MVLNNTAIKSKVDDLLGKSIQLDQAIMLLSEVSQSNGDPEINSVLKEIEKEAEENARTIKQARQLVQAS